MPPYALTRTEPEPNDEDTLWYLAYGSNMDPKVLTDRRKITPLESLPVIVPEYWLSFDIGGVPFIEPCFASILKIDKSRLYQEEYARFVHDRTKYGQAFLWDEKHPEKSYPPILQGVAHRITFKHWQMVIQSEGGWGHDVPTGYNQIMVNCTVVGTNEQIAAHVLDARPLSIKTRCQPSARYKNLLTAGAAYHNLDPAYRRYLATIVPYQCSGLRSRFGQSLFMVFNLPMLIAFALLLRRNKGLPAHLHTQPPFWMAWYFDKASRFSNAAHDYIVAPLLGSGRCSTDARAALTCKMIEQELAEKKAVELEAKMQPEI
ncbi:hypothetical protein BG005_007967 [Podila minutissima]|nr:hypothetical protein BG005_007967 [Podila minutissima]